MHHSIHIMDQKQKQKRKINWVLSFLKQGSIILRINSELKENDKVCNMYNFY